jgi:DNA-binding transcriptional ArsR family regulator
MDEFDDDTAGGLLAELARGYLPKQRQRQPSKFLKGPVPMEWLQAASCVSGAALAVGNALWFLAGVTGRREALPLSTAMLAPFGIGRDRKSRALRALEKAGLVRVVREGNHSPVVDIIVLGKNTGSNSSVDESHQAPRQVHLAARG